MLIEFFLGGYLEGLKRKAEMQETVGLELSKRRMRRRREGIGVWRRRIKATDKDMEKIHVAMFQCVYERKEMWHTHPPSKCHDRTNDQW